MCIRDRDYFEYVSENKARFKGETADYSVLYDPANELLYIEKAGAQMKRH